MKAPTTGAVFAFLFWMRLACLKSVFFAFLLVLILARPSFAAPSAGTSHPAFQALLAALLDSGTRTDVQKIERLDQFLMILQKNFSPQASPVFVKDFQTYLAFRNQRFLTPEIAFQFYLENGLMTPLNIRAANSAVMEQIISFEINEIKSFQEFSNKSSKAELSNPGLQTAALNFLPELYSLGLETRNSLDTGSAQLIQSSFEASEKFRKSHNPLGIFAFAVGAGASMARFVGESVVTPVMNEVVYGTTTQQMIRQKAFTEISKITAWPAQKKLDLVHQFEKTLDSALADQIQTLENHPGADRWAQQIPAVDVLRGKLLPFLFSHISQKQKSQLVWTVLNDPDFIQKKPAQQMQIALNAMGPLMPFLLREVAKLPTVKESELGKLFCCEKTELSSSFKPTELKNEIEKQLKTMGYRLVKLNPSPLAITAFKESYQIQVQNSNGEQQLLFVQILRPGVQAALQDDVQMLRSLTRHTELQSLLQKAGIPDLTDVSETLIERAQSELNFKKNQDLQIRAQKAYEQNISQKIQGKNVQIELKVAETLTSQETAPNFQFQEFAKGLTVDQARMINPEIVKVALEALAENYIKQIYSGSGVLWSEPSERNIRINLNDQQDRVRLTLMNLGTSEVLTAEQVKSFYANIAKLPFRKLLNFGKESAVDIQKAELLVNDIVRSGFKMDATTMKLATGFLHLHDLIGAEKFQALILKAISSHPTIAWIILSTKTKQGLAVIYDRLQQSFDKKNPLQKTGPASSTVKGNICHSLF